MSLIIYLKVTSGDVHSYKQFYSEISSQQKKTFKETISKRYQTFCIRDVSMSW